MATTMSEVHVHGLANASDREAIEEAGARAIVHRDVAAIASGEGATMAAELMRRHWRLLEAVVERTTVLPVRFGTAMAGDEAVVEEFLAPHHDGLAAQLKELDGKVQMTVKGSYDEADLMRSVVAGSPAIAAVRERVRSLPDAAGHFERMRLGEMVAAEVERIRGQDQARLLERLEPFAVATSPEPTAAIDSAANLAFLVERARAGEFSRAAESAAEELEGRVRLRVVGPLPPYSFAGELVA
jgi:hypothetical protein